MKRYYKVKRTEGNNHFPLIDYFYAAYDDDHQSLSPWKCELCTSKKARQDAIEVPKYKFVWPIVCAKCGLDFER
jgi:hypothetical protein